MAGRGCSAEGAGQGGRPGSAPRARLSRARGTWIVQDRAAELGHTMQLSILGPIFGNGLPFDCIWLSLIKSLYDRDLHMMRAVFQLRYLHGILSYYGCSTAVTRE